MLTEVQIDEPIETIIGDWDFLDEKIVAKFTSFRTVGQNIYGIRRRTITREAIVDPHKGAFAKFLELGAKGAEEQTFIPMQLHITAAGTPHRVPHSMGFWHINDMDELYLPLPSATGDGLGHFVVIMQTPTGHEGESFAFYCLRCMTLLHEVYCPTGQIGLAGIFRAEERAVREFNADPTKRVCIECGYVNPAGYCWNTAKDSDEERAARAIW
jgi:hypothetical protein